jgi:hypothetical protein
VLWGVWARVVSVHVWCVGVSALKSRQSFQSGGKETHRPSAAVSKGGETKEPVRSPFPFSSTIERATRFAQRVPGESTGADATATTSAAV